MSQESLLKAIQRYNDLTNPERSQVFQREIYPLIEEMINGVFCTLEINTMHPYFLSELKQCIYVKILPALDLRGKGIRQVKNYLFISIRNETLLFLKRFNYRIDFERKISQILQEDETQEIATIKNGWKPTP